MAADAAPCRKARFRWTRRLLVGVLGLLLGLGLIAFLFPEQVLLMESGEVQADVIVVLGGGLEERPTRAAELFKSGAAREIIVSGAGDAENNRRSLERKGVPAGSIQLEPKSKSTRQNAQFCLPLLRALSAKRKAQGEAGPLRVIIVTSWYHSRRALKCFRHYAPDIQFYSRPSYFAYPRSDWSPKGIAGYIRAEHVKLLGYWVCYGVCPF